MEIVSRRADGKGKRKYISYRVRKLWRRKITINSIRNPDGNQLLVSVIGQPGIFLRICHIAHLHDGDRNHAPINTAHRIGFPNPLLFADRKSVV